MVLSMDRWVGKVAVVTGASSGIGKAIAEELVKQGLQVAALARRKDRLDEMAENLADKKGKLFPIQADLAKEEDILSAFKWIKENLGPIHVLVNNAAFMEPENMHDGHTENWERSIEINVIALAVATREAIKDMKAHNVDGHIIHINSSVGHSVANIPNLSIYPATKFAVRALAETLRLELDSLKSKIKITNLSPGPVNTEFLQNYMRHSPGFKKIVEQGCILQAEDIADAIVYALSTPPHVQIQQVTIRPVP